ncbi:BTB/POZ domain-containing protein 16 [Pelobates fuscus]|uniref:BTB/POZ domain-containing protein 16 n=1 Tax=Pelobates fuscus TaxID=191477 RepID=UPI002FE43684
MQSSGLISGTDTSHTSHSQSHSSTTERKTGNLNISLDVQDKLVTQTSLAIALQNLYRNDIHVDGEEAAGVLAAAFLLQFPALFQECVLTMRSGISETNVCLYYSAACKYKQYALIQACEEWLLLNLVAKLGSNIMLRDLPYELLLRLLKSHRLFTYSEYRLLRTVLYWVYLQHNRTVQIVPNSHHVLNYFKSFPKHCAFLQQAHGEQYIALFQSLRLHGITESKQIEVITQINILPPDWMIQLLFNHCEALKNGGELYNLMDFNTHAV